MGGFGRALAQIRRAGDHPCAWALRPSCALTSNLAGLKRAKQWEVIPVASATAALMA